MTNQIGMTQEPDILFVTCVCTKSNSSYLFNVQNEKTAFFMASKKGLFEIVELMANNLFKAFSINLTAKDVNGMTLFDGKLAKIHVVRFKSKPQYTQNVGLIFFMDSNKKFAQSNLYN